MRDVDGLFVRYRTTEPLVEHSVEFGEYLGIQPRYADSTDIGGGSFEAYVHHAHARGRRRPLRGGADRLRLAPAESAQPLDARGGGRLQSLRPVRGAVRHPARPSANTP